MRYVFISFMKRPKHKQTKQKNYLNYKHDGFKLRFRTCSAPEKFEISKP